MPNTAPYRPSFTIPAELHVDAETSPKTSGSVAFLLLLANPSGGGRSRDQPGEGGASGGRLRHPHQPLAHPQEVQRRAAQQVMQLRLLQAHVPGSAHPAGPDRTRDRPLYARPPRVSRGEIRLFLPAPGRFQGGSTGRGCRHMISSEKVDSRRSRQYVPTPRNSPAVTRTRQSQEPRNARAEPGTAETPPADGPRRKTGKRRGTRPSAPASIPPPRSPPGPLRRALATPPLSPSSRPRFPPSSRARHAPVTPGR